MYRIGEYLQTDLMYDIINDNYRMLLVISRFNIPLGFDNKTVKEVCEDADVDINAFLTISNLLSNNEDLETKTLSTKESIEGVLSYLKNSHKYFLEYRLPAIRAKLSEALSADKTEIAFAIITFFDDYVAEIERHMDYEDEKVFPYIERLCIGEKTPNYNISTFEIEHTEIEAKLRDLKSILIKYYKSSNHYINAVLFDIYDCQEDILSHGYIEDHLLIPAVKEVEK